MTATVVSRRKPRRQTQVPTWRVVCPEYRSKKYPTRRAAELHKINVEQFGACGHDHEVVPCNAAARALDGES